jgi:hypothetical protein
LDKCFALVTSGLPPSQILFEGSICNVQSALQKLKFGFDLFDATLGANAKIDVASPMFLRSYVILIFLCCYVMFLIYENGDYEKNTHITHHTLTHITPTPTHICHFIHYRNNSLQYPIVDLLGIKW